LARVGALLKGQPDLARRLWLPAFARAIEAALAQFEPDIVQVEGLELAAYIGRIRAAAPRARLVYDAHNAEHLIQRRAWQTDRRQLARWPAALYSAVQVARLERLEAQVCAQVDGVVCVSAEDAAALRRLAPAAQPVVVPNGVDTAGYTPGAIAPAPGLGGADLLFTGKMDYRPNLDAALWFARSVLPLIAAQRPEARFVIVGQQPPPALRRLADTQHVLVADGRRHPVQAARGDGARPASRFHPPRRRGLAGR
jgi:glycosyltransferase involved in cell wall biosynthesis